MAEKKQPKRVSEIVDALFEFIEDPDVDFQQLPLDKVERELKEMGIDTAPLVGQVLNMVAAVRAERGMRRARQQRERLIERQRHADGEVTPSVDTHRRYERAVAQSGAAPAFRKFEGVSDKDKESTLEDLDFLEGMDEEDKGKSRG